MNNNDAHLPTRDTLRGKRCRHTACECQDRGTTAVAEHRRTNRARERAAVRRLANTYRGRSSTEH